MTEQKTDLRGLRTGVRLFVFTTPTAVAVLAVATDSPAVMVLIAVPGAVVGAVLHQERRRITDQPALADPVPGRPDRPCPGQSIAAGLEATRGAPGRDIGVGRQGWHESDMRHLLSISRSSGSHRRVAHWDGAGTMPVPGQGPSGGARLRPQWSWSGCHGEPDCGGSPQGGGTPRPHRTSGSVGWSCRAGRAEKPVGDRHRGTS